jgi:Zn finger protein HypA/HybF involved in hydrogenase expression
MYQFDCVFCDSTIQAESEDAIQLQSRTHLTESHRPDVLAIVSDKYDEISCTNCDSAVPINGGDVAGVECPQCEHGNFSALLERYVYWRFEVL